VDSLSAVNDATKSPTMLLYHFELKLATVMGFQPRFEDCISCRAAIPGHGDPKRSVAYHLGRGGPLCVNCASVPGPLKKLSVPSLRILKVIAACEVPEEVISIASDSRTREEINGFLWDFLHHHISGMRTLKSSRVFSKILDAS
jgi:recombinational DNA repair protein (RecF pathway)